MISVLAIVAPFFFVLAVIDLLSLNPQKLKWRQKRTAKSRKGRKNYSRVLAFKRIVRNMKKHAQFLFMITISLTIIAQPLTYNSIMELNRDQTDLIQNGNGFRLDFQISNECYTYFNPIAQDVRENTEINSLIQNDISMYIAKEKPLSSYPLTLINSSVWKTSIDIPRSWISLPPKQLYSELSTNGSILVSETFLEQEDYQIGDSFTFIYETIDGQPKQKELTIIGSFSRFPLLTSTLTDSPASRNIIADLSFFSDIELTDMYWVFYPIKKEYVRYDLYDRIRTQISASDTNNSIGILTEVGDVLVVKPDIPYSKFLQVEGIGLGVIILIGLIILVNRQFHSSSGAGFQFRMKGMSKRTIRRFYLTEFIVMLMFSFLIFIPSYAISLQSVIGLNESIIESLLPYTISVPYLGIVLLTGIFFATLLVSYSIIVWRGMQKTDRKKSVSLTIS